MISGGDRSEIVFFDVETIVPTGPGQGFSIVEFGAILVCPRKLVELETYSTLVRPANPCLISGISSARRNGITKDDVISAPTFAEIADRVYDLLHGRIWAGHNILRFDCARIREAFLEINRSPPEPRGTIDSLALLNQKFGRRAGDMKMATLATYFGLGEQTHRSLDDVRMNLDVLKFCATVLFLESSLPDIFTENSWVSPNVTTRSHSNDKASCDDTSSSSSTAESHCTKSYKNQRINENHPILSLMTPNTGEDTSENAETITAHPDPFNMRLLFDDLEKLSLQSDNTKEESDSESCNSSTSESSSSYADFLDPGEVSIPSISVSLAPSYRGTKRVQIVHNDVKLQLCCTQMKVRFGISSKFVDHAGRPRLNFVVAATPKLCQVLDACDDLAQRLSVNSGSSSEWWPVVTRKPGFLNSPTVRLHIPTIIDGSFTRWMTEIYKKESSTTLQRLVFSKFDVSELDTLFSPSTLVDAYFSLDPYDYHQNAGIRLVAKKLIIHSS
ncbi:DNA-directed DNA polymerase [Bertholletia excelsa]